MVRVDLCVTVDYIIRVRVRLEFSIRVRVRVQILKYLSLPNPKPSFTTWELAKPRTNYG